MGVNAKPLCGILLSLEGAFFYEKKIEQNFSKIAFAGVLSFAGKYNG